MEKWLDDLWPVMDIEHDAILSKSGDVTVAFEVTLPEIFTLSNEDYEAIHQTFGRAIKVLKEDTVFHKQDWFTNAQHRIDEGRAGNTFLSKSSDRFFDGRPYLDHRCFILLTKKASGKKAITSLLSNLIRPALVPEQTLSPELFQDFLNTVGQFERVLSDSGFVRLRRMSGAELRSEQGKAGLPEQYYFLASGSEPGICDTQLGNNIRIGDKHCQLFTLADAPDLPSLCGSRINYDKFSTERTKYSIGFAAPLGLLLNCNHIYNQYVFVGDGSKTIQKLESRKLRLQSLASYSRENAIARDAVNEFLNEAVGEQRIPVKAHFNVFTWDTEEGELNETKNKVAAAMAQLEATLKQETVGAAQVWWAGIPGNEGAFPENDCFDTFIEQATCFLNLETNYRSSDSPFGIRLGDRLTGRPVHVDIDDEVKANGTIANFNLFCLSGSGGGKSYWTNHLVRSYVEQNCHVVIVDVGHSYQILCGLLKGYYFTYEESNPIKFNPFYLAPGDTLDTETRESIKTLLLALWKKSDEVYNRSEYVALSTALQLYFDYLKNNPSVFPCFNSFYEFLQEEYTQVLERDKVKEKEFDVANFLYVLRPFFRGGEFDYLLNATENLNLLDQKFIVFELDNIRDSPTLLPVTTLMIMQTFVNKMRKLRGVRKMIVIEEAWKAIAREGMAEYIKYLFKTARKFFAKTVLVTQEVEDIISSPIIKQAIINNSDCKVLLDQSKYQNKFVQIQELLGISDKQKAEILSLNKSPEPGRKYKDLWICLGTHQSKVYRLETSREEYFTYTSEQKEKLKVLEAVEKFDGDYEKAIAYVASEQRA